MNIREMYRVLTVNELNDIIHEKNINITFYKKVGTKGRNMSINKLFKMMESSFNYTIEHFGKNRIRVLLPNNQFAFIYYN